MNQKNMKFSNLDLSIGYEKDFFDMFNLKAGYTYSFFNDSADSLTKRFKFVNHNYLEGEVSFEEDYFFTSISAGYDFGGYNEYTVYWNLGYSQPLTGIIKTPNLFFNMQTEIGWGSQNFEINLKRLQPKTNQNKEKNISYSSEFAVLFYCFNIGLSWEYESLSISPSLELIKPMNLNRFDRSSGKSFLNIILELNYSFTF